MNIGIILPHLIPSQLGFEVTNIINQNHKKYAYTIFYEDLAPNMLRPICPVMNIADLKYFKEGKLISFSLDGAFRISKQIGNIDPLLYIYDLEWLRGKKDYVANLSIMRNIPLVTRSEEYSRLVQNYCNSECPFKRLDEVLCP